MLYGLDRFHCTMLYGLDRFHCTMLYGYSQRLNCILSLYSLSKLLEYDIEERGKLAWEQDKSPP